MYVVCRMIYNTKDEFLGKVVAVSVKKSTDAQGYVYMYTCRLVHLLAIFINNQLMGKIQHVTFLY